MEASDVDAHVDVRVPLGSLEAVKLFLESNDIEYSVMIEDLQVKIQFPLFGWF